MVGINNDFSMEEKAMTNLEIAKVFNEEESFKENVLRNLMEDNGNISMSYCIFAEDHEPLTEEQQKFMDKYGDGDEIQLFVEIDLDELLG